MNIASLIEGIVALIKSIWGTDTTAKTTVTTATPDVEISDGKTEEDRRNELGY